MRVLPFPAFLGTVCCMEPTPFELTPAQKGLLESLARETGEPVSALIDKALEGLEEQVRHEHGDEGTNGSAEERPAPKPIWEKIRETFSNLSEEDLASLPVDGAAQVDHYAYGLPKR